jgi:ABC-type transport system substrate-binding protein
MPIIKEQQARRIAYERGESVVWSGLTQPEDIDRAKAMPNSDMTMTLGFHMFYLCFNMRKEPLASQPIRQAIAHCVDRDNIIRTLRIAAVTLNIIYRKESGRTLGMICDRIMCKSSPPATFAASI